MNIASLKKVVGIEGASILSSATIGGRSLHPPLPSLSIEQEMKKKEKVK